MNANKVLPLVGCIAASLAAASPFGGPAAGQPYPSLVLPSLAGGAPLSIAQFRGKKVLLLQFASW